MAQWCNPLNLQPEQSGGVGSIPSRIPKLECYDKGEKDGIHIDECFESVLGY